MKPAGEIGYIEPKVVNSARKRALELEKKRKAEVQEANEKALDEMTLTESDESKSKAEYLKDRRDREKLPTIESPEVLKKYKLSQMSICDSYSPTYEFE